MIELYYIIQDNLDGSCSVKWFKNKQIPFRLVEDDDQRETYGMNEGQVKRIVLPDDIDVDKIAIYFSDKYFEDK